MVRWKYSEYCISGYDLADKNVRFLKGLTGSNLDMSSEFYVLLVEVMSKQI